ncbi:hypothetical protein, partial [Longimicrobium sp.]|uniref:hypothetical protein n=1 Tax=Longimicrobium sp. TaxID=2029185 RepID=UPI002F932452
MEILVEIVIWVLAELLIPCVDWLLRPLANALRSAYGGRVLTAVWLACGGCCWLAWRFDVAAEREWVVGAAGLAAVGAPAFAMLSFLV